MQNNINNIAKKSSSNTVSNDEVSKILNKRNPLRFKKYSPNLNNIKNTVHISQYNKILQNNILQKLEFKNTFLQNKREKIGLLNNIDSLHKKISDLSNTITKINRDNQIEREQVDREYTTMLRQSGERNSQLNARCEELMRLNANLHEHNMAIAAQRNIEGLPQRNLICNFGIYGIRQRFNLIPFNLVPLEDGDNCTVCFEVPEEGAFKVCFVNECHAYMCANCYVDIVNRNPRLLEHCLACRRTPTRLYRHPARIIN